MMKEWTLVIGRGDRSPCFTGTDQEQRDEVEGQCLCPDIHQEAF